MLPTFRVQSARALVRMLAAPLVPLGLVVALLLGLLVGVPGVAEARTRTAPTIAVHGAPCDVPSPSFCLTSWPTADGTVVARRFAASDGTLSLLGGFTGVRDWLFGPTSDTDAPSSFAVAAVTIRDHSIELHSLAVPDPTGYSPDYTVLALPDDPATPWEEPPANIRPITLTIPLAHRVPRPWQRTWTPSQGSAVREARLLNHLVFRHS